MPHNCLSRLGRELLFFDGAMGTMLQARGLKLREIPESLNVTHGDMIQSIHGEYLAAGAHLITTNTFGVNPFKLESTGYSTEELVEAAVSAARQACDKFPDSAVVLDIGPSGRVLAPLGDASFDEVYDSVARQVKAGAHLCDAVLLETFTDLYELKASVLAVKEHCDKPIFATMSFEASGRTFFGADLDSMVLTLEALGVTALGINCSLGPAQLKPLVERLCKLSRLPLLVQPNAGLPVLRDGKTCYDIEPQDFANTVKEFAEMGVAVLGGCCGTTPKTMALTVETLGRGAVKPRHVTPRAGLCSASQALWLDDVVIIGERINPTGKKALQAALRAGDMDYVLREALTQQDQGAQILDVNVGLPDIDEPAMLTRAVMEIQGVTTLPLQIDSASPQALERAVRIYNGKPLINSVNGKDSSLTAVLPIAKRYGAAVLGLSLDDNGIPESAEDRLAIARHIVNTALALGIPREDIFIDCLTLTASAQQDLVRETLRALRLVKEELGVKTVLGVSNVSFGLPRRPLVNHTMLALALAEGLDAPIMNPGDSAMQDTIAAWRVLMGRDRDSQDFIARAAQVTDQPETASSPLPSPAVKPAHTATDLTSAISRGLKDDARRCADQLLSEMTPLEVVEHHIVPALDAVGRDYETQKIFLPQLIKSAEAAKAAFERLQIVLASQPAEQDSKGATVVLATVSGDVHDIGKNIVKVIMENYNFNVIDLGRDVDPQAVVDAVKINNAPIVGLSALMTTTVTSMKETIELLRQHCPAVKIIVGGAVLTPDLARFTGADHYARDAMETVRIATQIGEELSS